MTLNLDKSTWKRVCLRDVIRHVTDRVNAETSGLERFLAGEHIPSGSLSIREWGVIGRDPIGPMFFKRFRPGHVLYVSRRSYLRKTAVPDFIGICGEKTFVLETLNPTLLSQEFLPFLLSAERFHSYAVAMSRGSVNPYINWTDLAAYEFDLPPLHEQKRIAGLLWAVERHSEKLTTVRASLLATEAAWTADVMSRFEWTLTISNIIQSARPLCYGVVQPGTDSTDGVGLIRVMDLESGIPDITALKRITREIDTQYRRSRVIVGDVLVSIVGTIGRTWTVTEEFGGLNIARALARIAPDPQVMRADFLEWALTSQRVQSVLIKSAFESARKTLNLSVLANVALPKLSLEEQYDVMRRRSAYVHARQSSLRETVALRRLKSAIMDDVFGGPE